MLVLADKFMSTVGGGGVTVAVGTGVGEGVGVKTGVGGTVGVNTGVTVGAKTNVGVGGADGVTTGVAAGVKTTVGFAGPDGITTGITVGVTAGIKVGAALVAPMVTGGAGETGAAVARSTAGTVLGTGIIVTVGGKKDGTVNGWDGELDPKPSLATGTGRGTGTTTPLFERILDAPEFVPVVAWSSSGLVESGKGSAGVIV